MRILRFNEQELQELDTERCDEIMQELGDIAIDLNQKGELIESFLIELRQFKHNGKIDQIDNSINGLEVTRKNIKDTIVNIDKVVSSLTDYITDGRKLI